MYDVNFKRNFDTGYVAKAERYADTIRLVTSIPRPGKEPEKISGCDPRSRVAVRWEQNAEFTSLFPISCVKKSEPVMNISFLESCKHPDVVSAVTAVVIYMAGLVLEKIDLQLNTMLPGGLCYQSPRKMLPMNPDTDFSETDFAKLGYHVKHAPNATDSTRDLYCANASNHNCERIRALEPAQQQTIIEKAMHFRAEYEDRQQQRTIYVASVKQQKMRETIERANIKMTKNALKQSLVPINIGCTADLLDAISPQPKPDKLKYLKRIYNSEEFKDAAKFRFEETDNQYAYQNVVKTCEHCKLLCNYI